VVKRYASSTIEAASAVAWPATPDYFIYSPDVFNNATYYGGWLTIADIGPDQLYQSAGAATDNPVSLVWNGYVPYGAYHVNDPSVVAEANGTLAMFVTALPNADGNSSTLMMEYNQTALATSTNGGASWTWQGIVIAENNGYNNTGAWSPSALVVGNQIDLWYNTGATDVVTGVTAPPEVLLTTMDATGTKVQSTVVCYDTSTNAPLTAWNVDIKQAADGTYWMVANYFANNTLVAYESADGINWTPWSTSGATLVKAGNTGDQFNFLTPTILSVGNGQLDIMVAERIGNSDIEHTINFNLTDGLPTDDFLVSNVVNGIQGVYLSEAGETYSGPVTYLEDDFIYLGPEDLNIIATIPNVFLRGGSGNDALVAQSGNNVLDGGTGSNFLTGGPGHDTFYLEAGDGQDAWSTIVNFHSGDQLTLWDLAPGVKGITWKDNMGAAGYTGATGCVTDCSGNTASVTLAGWSVAQAAGLDVSFGVDNGLLYMHLSAN
jgi:Ca2+-binding RTX toxin-like protein